MSEVMSESLLLARRKIRCYRHLNITAGKLAFATWAPFCAMQSSAAAEQAKPRLLLREDAGDESLDHEDAAFYMIVAVLGDQSPPVSKRSHLAAFSSRGVAESMQEASCHD